MAAVTVTAVKGTVQGNVRVNYYTVNTAASGDTLDVPFRTVHEVGSADQGTVVTGVTTAAIAGNLGTRLTIATSAGAKTGLKLTVTGV